MKNLGVKYCDIYNSKRFGKKKTVCVYVYINVCIFVSKCVYTYLYICERK